MVGSSPHSLSCQVTPASEPTTSRNHSSNGRDGKSASRSEARTVCAPITACFSESMDDWNWLFSSKLPRITITRLDIARLKAHSQPAFSNNSRSDLNCRGGQRIFFYLRLES